MTESTIRVGFRTATLSDERLRYVTQLGVEDVFLNPVAPSGSTGDIYTDESDRTETDRRLVLGPDHVPSVAELRAFKRAAADMGVRLAGIHSLGFNSYGDIMFGRRGRDDQLEAISRLIEHMGVADLPVLGYQWNPRGLVPMRTSLDDRIRGDAQATAWDSADLEPIETPVTGLDRSYDEAELWGYYESFLEAVLPVAERSGVRLALHPIDPPVLEELGGIPRLFRDPESFERAMAAVPSDHHGLKLCLGCFSEMGEDVIETIHRFGEDIVFVHFRDVIGTYPDFTETFVDDPAGNFDAMAALEALREVDFSGVIIPDHVPTLEADTDWGHRGRGFTAGYLRGLLRAVSG